MSEQTKSEQTDNRVAELQERLRLAQDGLRYVLDHHFEGSGCLCTAGRVTAEAALRLSSPGGSRS